jgi:hypothetical protein
MRMMQQRSVISGLDDLDAVRFNRNKINRQLSKLDLAPPALEPEVIGLGHRR